MFNYKKARQLIAAYKFNSIFTKTFALLTIFSVVILFIFYMFISNYSARRLIEESKVANLRLVQQTANSADLALANLCTSMHTTLFNKNVIPIVIAPKDQPHEKKVALTRQLSDSIKTNKLIVDAAVHITLTDQVYAANGSITMREAYDNRDVLDSYFNQPYQNLLDLEDVYLTDIRFVGERLFLFQEFPDAIDVRVGTLVYELDCQILLDSIQGFAKDRTRQVAVSRPDGSMVLPSMDTSMIPADLDLTLLAADEGFFPYQAPGHPEQTVFFHRSGMTGWIFLYSIPSSELRLTFAPTFGGVLPFLAIFLLFSMILALYITIMIYRPINQLMESVTQPQANDLPPAVGKNELDYLGIAYRDVKSRRDTIATMMGNIAPTVLERLFSSCLLGKEISADSLSTTLQSLPVPFRENDRYMVVVVLFTETLRQEKVAVEQDICAISVTNLIYAILQNMCDCFVVRMEDDMLAAILRFTPETSAMQIKQAAIQFVNRLLEQVAGMPYMVRVGKGRIYNHVLDLHDSYHDALAELHCQSYAGSETDPGAAPTDVYYDKMYFINRIAHIVERVNERNYVQASELCGRVAEELSANVQDISVAKDICAVMADTLTEKLLSYRASANDPAVAERLPAEKAMKDCTTVNDLCAYMTFFFAEVIPLFEFYDKKLQHKHILRAKDIIEQGYADSGLSLHTVAETVGIHPSYLSRLFKENLGISFLDYMNDYRVERSKELLKSTALPVKEIGFKTGFQSMPTFFRVFKKYTGMSPGQYRN